MAENTVNVCLRIAVLLPKYNYCCMLCTT